MKPSGTTQLPKEVRDMVDASMDAVIVSDLDLRVIYYNANMLELAGLRPRALRKARAQGMCHSHFQMETCLEPEGCVASRALRNRRHLRVDEVRCTTPGDENSRRLIVVAVPLLDEQGQPYAVLEQYRDVTAESRMQEHYKRLLKKERERLERLAAEVHQQATLARTDPLTGVANRRWFDETLASAIEKSLASGQGLTLLMFDLDHFKKVNDTYGHQTGDEVLRQFAAVLRHCTRADVDVVARVGGEEFAVLMPGCTIDQAVQAYCRVRDRNTRVGLLTTCSCGIAGLGIDANDASSLFKAADKALYHSKEHGRNRVTVAADLNTNPLANPGMTAAFASGPF